MGNDGGSIPKRSELVKNAARAPTVSELKATALESLIHAWAHCALSGAPLDMETAVSDWRGRLYNYESVLNGLMPSDESSQPSPLTLGIKSLRDIVRLKFSKSGDKWACPISMKEMGPSSKAVYLVPCGHVFAEVALTEIHERSCPECGEGFEQENMVTLLPATDKDVQRLEKRMDSLHDRGLTHSLKKDKAEKMNKKKRKGAEFTENSRNLEIGGQSDKSSQKRSADPRISGINNPMAASLTAKVLAEQDDRIKRRKHASAIASR